MKGVKGGPGINSHQPRELALHYRQDPVITLSHQILGIFSDNESSQRDVAGSDSAGKFGVDPCTGGELTALRARNQIAKTIERMIDCFLPETNDYSNGRRVGYTSELGGQFRVGCLQYLSGERRRQSDDDAAISFPVVVNADAPPMSVAVHRGCFAGSHR